MKTPEWITVKARQLVPRWRNPEYDARYRDVHSILTDTYARGAQDARQQALEALRAVKGGDRATLEFCMTRLMRLEDT